jgi:hypothetical protein
MKKIVTALCLIFLLGSTPLLAAANPQQDFEKANSLFNQKQYTEAAGIYQRLIDEGYAQPELFLNSGNAWYKANRTGLAIYNYEKALLADPFNKPARHNLGIANQRVEGYVNDLPDVFFIQWWTHIRYLHHPNGWAAGSIIFFWLLTAGIIAMVLRPAFKPLLMRIGTGVVGLLFIVYLLMSVTTYSIMHTHDSGIIMSTAVKIKAAPDADSKDVFELHEGVKVQITDATNEFCKIELPDGKSGWMACGDIRKL